MERTCLAEAAGTLLFLAIKRPPALVVRRSSRIWRLICIKGNLRSFVQTR
jgi:hypothetical protein